MSDFKNDVFCWYCDPFVLGGILVGMLLALSFIGVFLFFAFKREARWIDDLHRDVWGPDRVPSEEEHLAKLQREAAELRKVAPEIVALRSQSPENVEK